MATLAVQPIDWPLFFGRIFHPDSVFWGGFVTTVYIAVLAQFFGVVLGLLSALARLSPLWPLKLLSNAYVLVVRGTPLILQIFFIYYGSKIILGFDPFPMAIHIVTLTVSGAIAAGITALSFNEGAYMSEIIRAGIGAIDPGQMEAAKSVGMTRGLAMRRIVLPQAARIIIPPLGNEFNGMIKNTSLLAFIGVYEMFEDAEIQYSNSFKPVEYFAAAAVWYLILTTIWSVIQIQIERKLSASDRLENQPYWWLGRFFELLSPLRRPGMRGA